MWIVLALLIQSAHATEAVPSPQPDVLNKLQTTRASISEDERNQREALNHLFIINKKVKDIARKQEQLNQKALNQEANVRVLAQDVGTLEERLEKHKAMLNRRLRSLYQERDQDNFHWLFSAQSPVELERNHRFLKRMIDSDHRQLKIYLLGLEDLKKKRNQLKGMVAHLVAMQKEVQNQEEALSAQLHEKSLLLENLKKSKDMKLTQLKGLRQEHSELNDVLSYAFFERKGILRAPVEGRITREFGTYIDPQFRFRLSNKGMFYSTTPSSPVKAVFRGQVVYADRLPGFGRAVIVDHGDNYYSIYAFAAKLKVREGSTVQEGDVVALSGEESPLFGPGLYFEIRHFTDAVDPRPWIKDSLIKTAESF